jgi:hypothetical protein
MKYTKVIFVLALVSVFWYGWFTNVIKLYQEDSMSTGQIVIRGVGIPFLPIGAVMGYIGE